MTKVHPKTISSDATSAPFSRGGSKEAEARAADPIRKTPAAMPWDRPTSKAIPEPAPVQASTGTSEGDLAAYTDTAEFRALMIQPQHTASTTTTAGVMPVSGALASLVEYANEGRPIEPAPAENEYTFPRIVDAASFTAAEIEEPPELVRGVIHKGSKVVFGGPSKAFKSWTLLDLSLSVANGAPWFGFETVQDRVLYINFELQPFAVQRRLQAIARARGMEVPHNLHIWNLRGHSCPLTKLLPELLRRAEGEGYGLIIPDPIYKTLDGRDENAAGDIGKVCNELEQVAVQTGAAVAFGAHFAKGNASGKESIDRISGSGVWARDPDSIMVATPHEAEGCFSIEMTLRNFAPPPPFVVKWEFPLMTRDEDLDPARLKQPKGKRGGAPVRPEIESLIPSALALLNGKLMNVTNFKAKLQRIADTQARARQLHSILVGDAHLEEYHRRKRGEHEALIGTPAMIKTHKQTVLNV
jgi:hypothetical protein